MKKRFYSVLASLLIIIFCITECELVMADEGETVRVGIYQMDGFHGYNEYGELEGYCIDYLNVVAGVTGWKYEYVEVADFMDGCNKLENGEIDLIAPAMMSDARKTRFAYSELDFGTEFTVLVTNSDREDLYYEDYEHFSDMKIAVLNDYPLTEYFITYMKIHDFSAELVYFDTIDESKAALKNGEVDAVVNSIMDMGENDKLLARFTPQPFYFLTNKNDTKFLGELNVAMNQVQNTYPTLLDELLVNYYPIYELQFYTRDELEYVENADVLKVAYVPERRPLSFKNDDGELDGISRAIFDKVAEVSGLRFEYVELPEGEITYQYLQEQGIDLITGVEYNSANMNSKGIFLSRPYISARKVMVSRPEFEYNEGNKYKLAVATGSQTVKSVLNSRYPNLEVVDYDTIAECFEALYIGEVDMLIQNQYVVDAILAKPIYSTFKVVPIDGLEDELCFSTIVDLNGRNGMDEEESSLVVSILNKAISQISDTDMDNMVMRETVENQYELDAFDFLYNYRFTIVALIGVFIILNIFAVIYFREKKKRELILEEEAKRTALQQRRYQTIVECSEDLIYEISLNEQSNIGSDKIRKKFGWEIPREVDELDFAKAMEILHVHPDDEQTFRQTMLTNGIGKFDEQVLRIGKANGEYLWCRVYRTLLMDDNHNVVSILGKIVDVDEEIKEKLQLEHKSRTDLLTGLLNKQTFEKEVREYVENHNTESSCFVFLDMDHFKDINDKFGHSVGDQVIRETAKKIQLLFANFDLVGRFGGDEFCVFVKEIPRDTLIDRLKFAVKKMEQEYAYEGGSVKISASIGAAYCKKEKIGYKEFMDVADAAAYQAKDNGRNCYIIKDVE
ncbi:MAG: transporter substrate-binding domain-containing protein [Agathobacter sp.]|nr:transporter substrate-binding domain-containing protein [Agathobacter sp.]